MHAKILKFYFPSPVLPSCPFIYTNIYYTVYSIHRYRYYAFIVNLLLIIVNLWQGIILIFIIGRGMGRNFFKNFIFVLLNEFYTGKMYIYI